MSLVTEIDYGTPASRSDKTVTLTIDGMEVHVPEGTSIMRAAMEVGTKIPKLCATDMLEAFGSCRLCLVEIRGRAGTPASCTTPVAPGMVVHTQTERLKALRKGVMELYISDHPLDCLTCAVNGNCALQTEAGNVGLRDVRYGYAGASHLADKKDESNPYFSYDPAKCIVCNRCIRACEEVQGTFALTIDGRGFGSRVSAGQMEPFLESECVSCLRRLRPGVPDRDSRREVGDRHRPGRTFGGDDLRLLRSGLQLQGRNAGRGARPHGSLQGRQGQPRPFLRQGPLRLGLCEP
jgi:formate dehydrogenase major subunit